MSDEHFVLEETMHDGQLVLRPVGELDMAAAPQVRGRLVEALRSSGPMLIVDCSRLAFIDSSGLSVLAHAQRHSEDMGGGYLRLACVPKRVSRVLELAGMNELLPQYPSVKDAIAGTGGPL